MKNVPYSTHLVQRTHTISKITVMIKACVETPSLVPRNDKDNNNNNNNNKMESPGGQSTVRCGEFGRGRGNYTLCRVEKGHGLCMGVYIYIYGGR